MNLFGIVDFTKLFIEKKETIYMSIYKVKDKKTISALFDGWEETMIWSCLQDCMGIAYTDDLHRPLSAQIIIGGFCFFAGDVNEDLIKNNPDSAFEILVPQNRQWEDAIELVYKENAVRRMRYATKKEMTVFDDLNLQDIVSSLSDPYELRLVDRVLYEQIMSSSWAVDLCVNFENYSDYKANGLGVVILKHGEIVSGASSYTFYNAGIEIEIDTREDERRKGLALVCGASLILECRKRNLYPSWDAHNLGSLALAEKLGYHFDKAYPVYEISGF